MLNYIKYIHSWIFLLHWFGMGFISIWDVFVAQSKFTTLTQPKTRISVRPHWVV
jgi:hypothetical protein